MICERDLLLIGGRLVAPDWPLSDLQFLATTRMTQKRATSVSSALKYSKMAEVYPVCFLFWAQLRWLRKEPHLSLLCSQMLSTSQVFFLSFKGLWESKFQNCANKKQFWTEKRATSVSSTLKCSTLSKFSHSHLRDSERQNYADFVLAETHMFLKRATAVSSALNYSTLPCLGPLHADSDMRKKQFDWPRCKFDPKNLAPKHVCLQPLKMLFCWSKKLMISLLLLNSQYGADLVGNIFMQGLQYPGGLVCFLCCACDFYHNVLVEAVLPWYIVNYDIENYLWDQKQVKLNFRCLKSPIRE